MIRRACIVSLVLFGAVGLLFLCLAIYTPASPTEWKDIQIGDTRDHILQREIVDPKYFIPVKYLDQAVFRSEHPIYGRVTHHLQISYSEDMKIRYIGINCETERFRLWRRRSLTQ